MSGAPPRRPRDRYGRPLPPGSADELARPAAVTLECALALFDERRFFEAHEVLEELWKAEPDEADRSFWKGLTQVAVGCCHVQRGNPSGAVTLLDRGLRRLAVYPPVHRGVSTMSLVVGAQQLVAQLRRSVPLSAIQFPRFDLSA